MRVHRTSDVVVARAAVLGEGPAWLSGQSKLLWVDIPVGAIHVSDPVDGNDTIVVIRDHEVGAAMPACDGGLVLATEVGFVTRSPDGVLANVGPVESTDSTTRMNDAKCDPSGRPWAGTIARDLRDGGGSLYCLDGCVVHRRLDGVTVSNGLGWSLSGHSMWFIDSFGRGVTRYAFDPQAGTLGDVELVIDIDPAGGLADGMCVDAEDGIWVARFGGSSVDRFDWSGVLTDRLEVPVTHPTSCAFGGDELDTLYVTSARSDAKGPMSEAQLASQPNAGSVFAFTPPMPGAPVPLAQVTTFESSFQVSPRQD